jgi:hypothetical protein
LPAITPHDSCLGLSGIVVLSQHLTAFDPKPP